MIKNYPCTVSVVEKLTKTDRPYKVLVLTIKGREVQAGIVNLFVENALLRAGIDVRSD